jgi:hypothetical protein
MTDLVQPYWPVRSGPSVQRWPVKQTNQEPWLDRCVAEGEPVGWEVSFTPPLVLTDTNWLRGNGRTLLKPNTDKPGPLVVLETSMGGNYDLQYPFRSKISDLIIQGYPGQVGLVISGGNMTLDTVTVTGCLEGVYVNWGVNVEFRNCLFTKNALCLDVAGLGPKNALGGDNSITTLRFSGCRFAASQWGALVQHGIGVLFNDGTTFEGLGVGVITQKAWPAADLSVRFRDTWFEVNGRDVIDPTKACTFEGYQARYLEGVKA